MLAHPELRSFNGHLAETSRSTLSDSGWEVTFSDLYRMSFDPCEGAAHYDSRADPERFHAQTEQRSNAENGTTPEEVSREIENLLHSDLLVVHFPLWWFGMPAILKGWIDRVFVYGKMYTSTMRYDDGICAGKKVIACITTGASQESCSFNGRESDTRLLAWPLLFPFRYLGFEVAVPEIFHGVGGVSFVEGHDDGAASTFDEFATRWSDSLAGLAGRPVIQYNSAAHFDADKRLLPDAPEYSPFVSHTDHVDM